MISKRLRVAAGAGVATLVIAGCGSAGTPKLSASPGVGGNATGIHVSGKWTIDVRRPDGSLARQVRFENSLQLGGAQELGLLLTGKAVAGHRWQLQVGNDQDHNEGPDGGAVPATATLDTNTGAIHLTASQTYPEAGDIGEVFSEPFSCEHGTLPADCDGSGSPPNGGQVQFTEKQFEATPISFAAGQTVDFSVVISFS